MARASDPAGRGEGLAGTDVTDALEELAHGLERADRRSSELLADVARSLKGEEEAVWGATNWSRVNLFFVFDVDAIARLLTRGAKGTWANLLEVLRGALILAPIVVTWYEVSLAVAAYRADVDAPKSVASTRPFLYLWQTRFDKHLQAGGLTFDQLARLDAVLVAAVIALTLFMHSPLLRRDVAGALARQRAQVRRVLGRASLALLDHRVDRPESALLQVMRQSETLLKELGDERRRVRDVTNEQAEMAERLRGAAGDFERGAATVVQSTRDLRDQYATITAAQQRGDERTAEHLGRADELRAEQRQTADMIAHAVHEMTGHMRGLDGAASALRGSVAEMTRAASDLTSAVGSLRGMVAGARVGREGHEPGFGNGARASDAWSSPPPGPPTPEDRDEGGGPRRFWGR